MIESGLSHESKILLLRSHNNNILDSYFISSYFFQMINYEVYVIKDIGIQGEIFLTLGVLPRFLWSRDVSVTFKLTFDKLGRYIHCCLQQGCALIFLKNNLITATSPPVFLGRAGLRTGVSLLARCHTANTPPHTRSMRPFLYLLVPSTFPLCNISTTSLSTPCKVLSLLVASLGFFSIIFNRTPGA